MHINYLIYWHTVASYLVGMLWAVLCSIELHYNGNNEFFINSFNKPGCIQCKGYDYMAYMAYMDPNVLCPQKGR